MHEGSFCFIVGILFIVCLAFSIQAKEQDEYTISWSDMSTETYTLASDKGPVFLGDGAEYIFRVTNPPDGAKFKWDIKPKDGVETLLKHKEQDDTLKWQAPLSSGKYTIKVDGWVPGPGEGGETLKGKWVDSLNKPILDVYFEGHEPEEPVYLPVTEPGQDGAKQRVIGLVTKVKEGEALQDINIHWEDGGYKGQPGDWQPKPPEESRTSPAGETSTEFTVGKDAATGDYQKIKGNLKTAKKAGEESVRTDTSEKINIFGVALHGFVYGSSTRQIKINGEENLNEQTITVISSGYVKFKAAVEPSTAVSKLYYKWTATAGTLDTPSEGEGKTYASIKWDAPLTAQSGKQLKLEIKQSAGGDVLVTRTVTINIVRPKIIKIKFVNDHDLKKDATTEISDPVYDRTESPLKNEPVAYTRRKRIKVQADAASSDNPNVGNLTQETKIKVTAEAYFDGTKRGFRSSSIDDNTDDWSMEDYDELTLSSKKSPYSKVKKYQDFEIRWYFLVKNKAGDWVNAYNGQNNKNAYQSTTHKAIYLTYSTPRSPMDKPWVEVLDCSCVWADGDSTQSTIIRDITTSIYGSGVYYNGYQHYTYPGYTQFHLENLLSDLKAPGTDKLDCRDFANWLHVLTNSLGLRAKYRVIDRTTPPHYFIYNYILPAGHTAWVTGAWNFHQIGWWSSKIADASLKLDNGPDPTQPPHSAKLASGDMRQSKYLDKLTETPDVTDIQDGVCSPR